MNNADDIKRHILSPCNRAMLEAAELCGCFYCLQSFPTSDIRDWLDESGGVEQTAICPYCGIDAVIAVAADTPVTAPQLNAMHNHWFGTEPAEAIGGGE